MAGHMSSSRLNPIESGSSSSSKRLLVEDADRVSTLPQDIQSQILLLLPTIDAAKVGLLSKTWRTIWFSLSKLSFDYSQFPRIENEPYAFYYFIDQTLACHDELDVKTLEVWLWPLHDCGFPIKSLWVTFAIMHKVEKLVLYGEIDEVKLPDCLFTCQSLVKLELAIPDLVLPSSETLALPNLRILKLKFLVLAELTLGEDLFSNLPSLEKLSIFFCYLGRSRDMYISSRKLKEFIICCSPGMENCSVELRAPSLSFFIYISDAGKDDLAVYSSRSRFIINGGDAFVVTENVHKLNPLIIKVAKELFMNTSLVLSSWLVQYLSNANDLARRWDAVVFHNMMKLEIAIWPTAAHFRVLILLLSRCPNLDELAISLVTPRRRTREVLTDESLAQYGNAGGFGKINIVHIMNFGGSKTEMRLVRFLLGKTPELDLMRIVINCVLARRNVVKKITELLAYERASPFADVLFD